MTRRKPTKRPSPKKSIKRPQIDYAEWYMDVRSRTMEICQPLETEDYVVQPAPFVHPVKWHIAYPTWIIEEKILKKYGDDYEVYHVDFSQLFQKDDRTKTDDLVKSEMFNLSRPLVSEFFRYRIYVDNHMMALLSDRPRAKLRQAVAAVLNIEQRQQEILISDIKYILGHNPFLPAYRSDPAPLSQVKRKKWISIKGGVYDIGQQDQSVFCFDNERAPHKVHLEDYDISSDLVTAGDYMKFVAAGGYDDASLWLHDGWKWLQEKKVKAPMYWKMEGQEWYKYTLGGYRKILKNEALTHISYYEAQAYASWKKLRLPTEQEWEVASKKIEWGQRWEWTNSAYLPYPGFKKTEDGVGELDGKFMSGQMVLRGSSVATAAWHSRSTYRHFLMPHLRWQFTGIRLAR